MVIRSDINLIIGLANNNPAACALCILYIGTPKEIIAQILLAHIGDGDNRRHNILYNIGHIRHGRRRTDARG